YQFAVDLGGKEVRAKYFGRGHTSGDVIVYFPELRTIHSGDLFLGRPGLNIYFSYGQGVSFFVRTRTLAGTRQQLDFATIIPGHGRVSTRDDLAKFRVDLES